MSLALRQAMRVLEQQYLVLKFAVRPGLFLVPGPVSCGIKSVGVSLDFENNVFPSVRAFRRTVGNIDVLSFFCSKRAASWLSCAAAAQPPTLAPALPGPSSSKMAPGKKSVGESTVERSRMGG